MFIFSNLLRAEGALFDERGAYYLTSAFVHVHTTSKNILSVGHSEIVHFDLCPKIDDVSLIYFDHNYRNYYHWMIDSSPKLYVMKRSVGLERNVIFPGTEKTITEWQRTSLEIVAGQAIMFLPQGVEAFKLEAAAWMHIIGITECVTPALQRCAALIKRAILSESKLENAKKRNKVYISRKAAAWRWVLNEQEVEETLSGYGFITVRPKTMTLAEQMMVFSRAEIVVGAHGAGFSNLIFCDSLTTVVEFFPWDQPRPFFWAICNRFGFRHYSLSCKQIRESPYHGPGDAPFGSISPI